MPQHNPERVLPFTEHLEELRTRLIILIVFTVVCFFSSLTVAPRIVEWLIAPLTKIASSKATRVLTLRVADDGGLRAVNSDDPKATSTLAGVAPDRIAIEDAKGRVVVQVPKATASLYFLSPLEPFMLLVKGALLASGVLVIPMTVYQLWLFIAPGLLRRERKAVKWILVSSMFLFPLGAGFAYVMSRVCLQVLLGFSDAIPGLQPNIVASKYIGFILGLMLVCGVLFEFPLVLVLLSRIGLVTSTYLVKKRKLAIVLMAFISAVATPSPDPFSMLVMLIPLLLLYEGSIHVIRVLEKSADQESKTA